MAKASPVSISIFTPIARAGNGRLGVFARRVEHRQHAQQLPWAIPLGSGHRQRAKAARREFVNRLVQRGLGSADVGGQGRNHLRRALRHLENLAVRSLDGGLGALVHGVERLEVRQLIAVQGLIVFERAKDGEIDGVVVFQARRQRGVEYHLLSRDLAHDEGLAQRQLVLGQGSRLVRAQHIHAGQLLDGDQAAYDRLFFGEQARADGHRHGQYRGHRHRNRGHGEHQGELQGGEHCIAAINGDADDHRHQQYRKHDQVIAYLQHRALEMADGVRLLHQLRRLAEIGVDAGGIDQGVDFALADDGSGKDRIAGLACRGQGLAGQRRLIHLDRIACEQVGVRWHDVAQVQADDVARNKLARGRGNPFPPPFHPGLDRQLGFQGGDGVAGFAFLPEADRSVGQQQRQDDAEVRPMPGESRQDHRRFNHPRDGSPEITEEFQERIDLLFPDLVRPVLGQPFLRLGLAEPIRRRSQCLLHLRQGEGFPGILRTKRRWLPGPGCKRLGLPGIGFHDVVFKRTSPFWRLPTPHELSFRHRCCHARREGIDLISAGFHT
nr:hypothetical protein [Chromobacterium sphagni]